jgi:hypothetical protein
VRLDLAHAEVTHHRHQLALALVLLEVHPSPGTLTCAG